MKKNFLLITLLGFLSCSNPKKNVDENGIYYTTATESEERIRDLGLFEPSEDSSTILNFPKLNFSVSETSELKPTIKGDPNKDFIIELKFENGHTFRKKDLEELFDKNWRITFTAAEIYGYSANDKQWTYALSGDKSEEYKQVEIAINLLEVFNDENPSFDAKKLQNYVNELNRKLTTLNDKVNIKYIETFDQAIEKSKKLVALNRRFNKELIISLKSKSQFDGKKAWDALLCVGLKWGDGDLFHWRKNNDEPYFSVWTSTTPGYFLPEQIKSGEMNPSDLNFGYSILTSRDPMNIYKAMLKAAKYCKSRLGGEILNAEGKPLNETENYRKIVNLIEEMNIEGIKPGTESAMRIYTF
ncbi:cell division protein ZipA C-terminal FtsZ-binding domain-containing protein [Pedobacter rhodius]|uniref:Cell division protein ZipA n=1 Tax=Pedobacter rhodius TaxID=3004098 RepID=A0ABT4L1V4_9SPHI|nr:cell division protein ZipA C-terminal FtsZ-binding domain-containing protein [Pedobacter sp. SJ11]MCZ4225162.1 hypothetical protein [Pedobacter sp. SJ11]